MPTMPRFPVAPHASPAAAPRGPMGVLQRKSLTIHSCVQLAQEEGLILLSKLFISSSKSRKLFFLDKTQRLLPYALRAPCWSSFYPCAQSHVPVGSAVLLTALALGQAVSRTGQSCMPPPLPPAGSLVSAPILKQTGCVLWLSIQPKGGWGAGSSKYPSYVNNQDYLAAHLIFCNFISVKVRASRWLRGPSYP